MVLKLNFFLNIDQAKVTYLLPVIGRRNDLDWECVVECQSSKTDIDS